MYFLFPFWLTPIIAPIIDDNKNIIKRSNEWILKPPLFTIRVIRVATIKTALPTKSPITIPFLPILRPKNQEAKKQPTPSDTVANNGEYSYPLSKKYITAANIKTHAALEIPQINNAFKDIM